MPYPLICLCRDSMLHVGALLRLVRETLLRRCGTLGDLEAVLVCPLLLPPADMMTRCGPFRGDACQRTHRIFIGVCAVS